MNRERATLIVGGYGSGKTTTAIKLMGDRPYKIIYANELDKFDIYSYPKDYGLIIEEVNYKPDTKKVLEIINVKSKYLILTSLNEKDISKTIINKCKRKRLGRLDFRQENMALAPNRNIVKDRTMSIFDLTLEWLKNKDRDEVQQILKHNKPADIQILSWVEPNINTAIISFVDSIKWKWNKDYFYELLAYSYDGSHRGKLQFNKRRTYSPVPKICGKLNLKHAEAYLVKSLLENEEYREYATKKLDKDECKILGLKKPRKKRESVRKLKLSELL